MTAEKADHGVCVLVLSITLIVALLLDRLWRRSASLAYSARCGEHRAILITGGASGIGLECARLFLRKGWFVGVADVNERGLGNAASQLQNMAPDESSSFVTIVCDVTSEPSFAAAMQRFEARSPSGRLDVLFNCAGLLRVGPAVVLPLLEQVQELRVNVEGILVGVRAALPALRRTAGSVVVSMASLAACYGVPTFATYSASKHAVRALTEALSLELERDAVRVCDVSVGFVRTPMITSSNAAVPKRAPLLRASRQNIWLEPDAVVHTVATAVDEGADPRKLHYYVDWLTWCAVKLTQLDTLLGLGASRFVQKALWIGYHDHDD